MSWRPRRPTLGIVKRTPGRAPAASGAGGVAHTAARRAWDGLVQVLVGPDLAPASRWRSPQERRAWYAALGMTTLVLCIVNVATMHGAGNVHGLPAGIAPAPVVQLPPSLGQEVLAVAVLVPLPLAVRYPLLAWRIGWLALLLAPLVPAAWWGGWPWAAPQLLALLVAFCLAGVRYQRPVLWWMWALSVIPWWLWLQADVTNLNGPASATIAFTLATIAVDGIGSRLRVKRALVAQTERTEVEWARRAVLEERTRIARELHDVVAHHMSLIAVRAETAPYRLSGLPESARAEFGSLSEVAREALADMRRLLGVLRHDQPGGLAPQPPAIGPPCACRCRSTSRGIGRAFRAPRPGPGAFWRWAVRVPDRAGIAVQRQPACPWSRGHRVGGPRSQRGKAARGQWTRRPRRPTRQRTPSWSRADRDARASGAARRLHVGRPGARRRLRGVGGAPTRRDGMTAGSAAGGGVTTRCLIADDQAMVREGFAAVLAAQPGLLVVGQAADGQDAVRQARHLQPDIVLMDVRMPVMDGLQATRQLLGATARPARPRVLMLTTFDLDDYVYEALRAGASGFLLKDATAAELVHAVRVVAAGDALLAPSVTRRLIADFARQPRSDPPFPSTLGALTQRETEVLRLIARGLSNTEISDTLVIAEQTTKTHIGRILAKLDLRDRAQAVVLAYETGLVTPGGPRTPDIGRESM